MDNKKSLEFLRKNGDDICMRCLEWLALSLLTFVFKYDMVFVKENIKESFLFGFALSFMWWVILFSLKSVFQKSYDRLCNMIEKVNEKKITISEKAVLQGISEIKPLYCYYSNTLDSMVKNIDTLNKGEVIKLTPFNIYDHIISASTYFTKSIRSIDCNINAWINVCEFEDYACVYGLKTNDPKYMSEKDNYDKAIKRRRRTDSTYQIYDSINNNLQNNETVLDRNPVKRIFLLGKKISELDKNEKMIIMRLQKNKNKEKGKIANKILIRDELDSKDKDKFDFLQDIIIFDGKVAYKEYFYREDSSPESEIFTDKEQLKLCEQYFDDLFDKSKDVNDIKF